MKDVIAVAEEETQARQLALGGPQLSRCDEIRRIGEVVLHAVFGFVERDVEIIVEIVGKRRQPGEAPSHALLERLDLRQRRARDDGDSGVTGAEMDYSAIEVVGKV